MELIRPAWPADRDRAAGQVSIGVLAKRDEAGDTRREVAGVRASLTQAKRDARGADAGRGRVVQTGSLRAAWMEREIAELERSEVSARVAQEGELGQAQAREAALEGAATGLREERARLSAEIVRLSGIVMRQHAAIDEIEAQGAQIVAKMDEIVGDQDDDRPRRRRR